MRVLYSRSFYEGSQRVFSDGDEFSLGGYIEVARLVVRDLDEAYRLMQVEFMPDGFRTSLRGLVGSGELDHISMSAGDCILWGDAWMCGGCGWRRVHLV